MTHLQCPLCGRFIGLTQFDSSKFDLDIYAVKMRGLGRGRGFTVDQRYSRLTPGNDTVEEVKNRIITLYNLLLHNGYLTPKESTSNLTVETTQSKTIQTLKNEIASLESEAEESNTRFNQKIKTLNDALTAANTENIRLQHTINNMTMETVSLEAELEEVNRQIRKVIKEKREINEELSEVHNDITNAVQTIDDTLTEDYEITIDEDEEPVEALHERVNTLIETVNNMNEELVQCIDEIEEALNMEESDYWKIDCNIDLQEAFKERFNYLLQEYESLASEAELNE